MSKIEKIKNTLYDKWLKYMDEWHPVNSIRIKSLSQSNEFDQLDKKVGLANHFNSRPNSKTSNSSIKRKIVKPTFYYEANTAKPKSFIKRKIPI